MSLSSATPAVASQQRDVTVSKLSASTSSPCSSRTPPASPHACDTGLFRQVNPGHPNPSDRIESTVPSISILVASAHPETEAGNYSPSHALIHESANSFPSHSPKSKRRLQAILFRANDPILSLHQHRFRPFALPDNTISPDILYSQAEYHREHQSNHQNPVFLPATPPATPTKISTPALRPHPHSSRQKESPTNTGHRGRGHPEGAVGENQTPRNRRRKSKKQQKSSSPTKPFPTTEGEEEMPLSLRVKDFHPFPRRSASASTTSSIHSTVVSTANPKSSLTLETSGVETITIPADSPSQSPLVLEPASTASGAGNGGVQGRMWYRKMSQWPPSEFSDPFAAPPIVIMGRGHAKHTAPCVNSMEKPGGKVMNRAKVEASSEPSIPVDPATTGSTGSVASTRASSPVFDPFVDTNSSTSGPGLVRDAPCTPTFDPATSTALSPSVMAPNPIAIISSTPTSSSNTSSSSTNLDANTGTSMPSMVSPPILLTPPSSPPRKRYSVLRRDVSSVSRSPAKTVETEGDEKQKRGRSGPFWVPASVFRRGSVDGEESKMEQNVVSSPELTVYGTPPKTPTRKHETHSNFAKSSKPLSPSPLPTLIDLGVDIGDTEHNMATPLAAVSPMHEVFSTAPSSPLPSPTRPLPPLPSAASPPVLALSSVAVSAATSSSEVYDSPKKTARPSSPSESLDSTRAATPCTGPPPTVGATQTSSHSPPSPIISTFIPTSLSTFATRVRSNRTSTCPTTASTRPSIGTARSSLLGGNTMSITSSATSAVSNPEDGDCSSTELPYLDKRRGSTSSLVSAKKSKARHNGDSLQGVGRVRSVLRKRNPAFVKGKKATDIPPVPPMPEFLTGILGSTVSLPTTSGSMKGIARPQCPARTSSPPTAEAAYSLNRLRSSRTLEDLTTDGSGFPPLLSLSSDPWTFILDPNVDSNLSNGVLASTCSLPSAEGMSKLGKDSEDGFDEWEGLSMAQVWRAAQMEVTDTDGKSIRFGSLFEEQRTICIFIRHFWCPFCQDYVQSIVNNASPAKLEKAGVKLVIVSNGSHRLAKAYQENVFKCPFPIFVDTTRNLYRALGMTRTTTQSGPEAKRGSYVNHGAISGLGVVLKNAMKMPLGNPGDSKQLGGEFILGPGVRCQYAHRMPTTKGHVDIKTLLANARVESRNEQEKLSVDVDQSRTNGSDELMRSRENRGSSDSATKTPATRWHYQRGSRGSVPAKAMEEDKEWGKRTMRDLLAVAPRDSDTNEAAHVSPIPASASVTTFERV